MSVAKKDEKPYTLSDEARSVLRFVLNNIWDEIGWDVFNAVEEEGRLDGKKGPITIPRADVIEVTLDAGRPEQKLEEEVRNDARLRQERGAREALTVWKTLSYDQMITEAKKVFTCARYGR